MATPAAARSSRASLPAVVAALLGVYIIWGSTYFTIRVAIETMPPLLMAAVRFTVAGVLLYAAIGFGPGRKSDPVTWRHWRNSAIIGLALLALANGGVTLGEEKVPSGMVALIVATLPLWIALMARVIFGERLRLLSWLGIVIGIAGVALLLRPSGSIDTFRAALVLLSPLCWAAGSLYARGAQLPRRPLVGTAMEMITGGLILFVFAGLHNEYGSVHWNRFSLQSILSFAYLVFFGSIVAYSCYVWLLRHIPTEILATYAYVNPLIAVWLGVQFLHEPFNLQTLIAGVLIIGAVAVIVASPTNRRRKASRAAAARGLPEQTVPRPREQTPAAP